MKVYSESTIPLASSETSGVDTILKPIDLSVKILAISCFAVLALGYIEGNGIPLTSTVIATLSMVSLITFVALNFLKIPVKVPEESTPSSIFLDLISKDWGLSVPSIEEKASADLQNLEKIITRLNDETDTIDRSLAEEVLTKCWDFALQCEDNRVAIEACIICSRASKVLQGKNLLNLMHSIWVFEDHTQSFPAFFKTLCAKDSPYFEELFKAESEKVIFPLKFSIFQIIINILQGKIIYLESMNAEQFLNFASQTQPLLSKSITKAIEKVFPSKLIELEKFLTKKLKDIKKKEIEKAIQIKTLFSSIPSDSKLNAAFVNYFNESFSYFKDFNQVQKWLQAEVMIGKDKFTTIGNLLTSIGCFKFPITDANIEKIAVLCPNLNQLNLLKSNISDKGLANLTELKSLQILNLCKCDQITDTGLKELSALTSLQSLNLSYCDQLTDSGLKELSALTSLQLLNLSNCDQLTDAGLMMLSALTCLQSLFIYNCDKFTDTGKKILQINY